MKTAVLYPPMRSEGEFPLLTQNRHLKYSKSREVRIFPLVPAHLATNLKCAGHEVLFLDGINRRMTDEEFEGHLQDFSPEIAFMETKTPVVPRHWRYVAYLKNKFPKMKTVLVGDHVTNFPSESIENSLVDYVITGGDFDVVGRDLVEHLSGKGPMPPGVWFRDANGLPATSGPHILTKDLDALPFIDRELTRFRDYGEAYLLRPSAYILTGRGCGAPKSSSGAGVGICTFCIWQHSFWGRTARLRTPGNVAAEMQECIEKYGVWEFFDDNESGPIYDPEWLKKFYQELQSRKLLGKFQFSSNCRADTLNEDVVDLLVKCGWRLLKIGLESGDDYTLKHIGKCESVDLIAHGIKLAKDRGLRVMLTTMMGYPWETEETAQRTYDMAKELLMYKVHTGDCLQASVVIAYPGTPLWKEASKKGWLLVGEKDYERYDMKYPILKTSIDASAWCTKTWGLMKQPSFMVRQVVTLRSWRELDLLWRGLKSLLGHVRDYEEPHMENETQHGKPKNPQAY